MNAARAWTLGAALGSFAAGVSVGFLFPRAFVEATTANELENEYVRATAVKYGLTASQEHSLGLIMRNDRAEELEVIKSMEASQLPPAVQSRLLAKNHKTVQRIRVLLDVQQRARYDEESRGALGDPALGNPALGKIR